jgi:hypothetical protein
MPWIAAAPASPRILSPAAALETPRRTAARTSSPCVAAPDTRSAAAGGETRLPADDPLPPSPAADPGSPQKAADRDVPPQDAVWKVRSAGADETRAAADRAVKDHRVGPGIGPHARGPGLRRGAATANAPRRPDGGTRHACHELIRKNAAPATAHTCRQSRSLAAAEDAPGLPEDALPGNVPASSCGDRTFQVLEMPCLYPGRCACIGPLDQLP